MTSTGQMQELPFKRLITLWNLSLTSGGAIYEQQLQTERQQKAFFFNVKKQLSLVCFIN